MFLNAGVYTLNIEMSVRIMVIYSIGVQYSTMHILEHVYINVCIPWRVVSRFAGLL